MRAAHRWGLAGVATTLAVLTPYAGRLHGVHDPDVATAALVAAVRDSADTPYSGSVDVQGRVGLPIADHFTDLADLFGAETRLRVWWRDDVHWRVDRLTDTGEIDLFHVGHVTTEWNYERQYAATSLDPEIRLPRDSDLLPPEVARRALDGEPTADIVRLPPRRIAGIDAAGLRVPISQAQSSLSHVDLWVDPANGVPLSASVYGDSAQPAVSTTFTTYSAAAPSAAVTRFQAARGVHRFDDRVIDIADAADQFAPVRPPASVAGLTGSPKGAAALYGSGLTRLLAIPLPGHDADELAAQLDRSGATTVHGQRYLGVGPLGVLVTRASPPLYVRWLLAGTVTRSTLLQAAKDLAAGSVRR